MAVIDIMLTIWIFWGMTMLIKDAVHVYRLIGGNKLALHGRHHSHEHGYEIHFFLEGSGTFLLNQSKYTIDGNRLFLTSPGEYHSILPEAIKSPVSYYAILFEPELPGDLETLSLLGRSGKRHFGTGAQERFLIEELYRLRGKMHIRAAEHLLLSLLYRWYDEIPHDPASSESSAHVKRALAIMEKSIKEKLSTDTLSEKLGISKEHFIRIFRGELGIPPLQYFTRLKIEAAGALLSDSNLKVGAVAEYFGFDSPFHFSRVFKKSTGLSPKEYRRRFRRP